MRSINFAALPLIFATLIYAPWVGAQAPATIKTLSGDTVPWVNPSSIAPITAVTLYPNNAVVERTVSVKAGDTRVMIPNIPMSFIEQSLQVEPTAGVEVGDTTIVIRERNTPLIDEERRLTQAVRALEEKIALLTININSAQVQSTFIDSYLESLKNGKQEKIMNGSDIRSVQLSLSEGAMLWQKQAHSAERDKADLDKELAALRADLARVKPTIQQLASLDIRLFARRPGQLKISYHIDHAGWRSGYRAHLSTDSGRIRLQRMAQIAQRSGEDWREVKVSLSTGSPSMRVNGPLPQTWEINLDDPNEKVGLMHLRSPAPAARAAPMMAKSMDVATAPDRPLFDIAANYGEYQTQFTASAPFSLPADGRTARLALEEINWDAELVVQTAPRLEKAAYLMATAKVPEGVWTSGELQVYRDDTYIGKTHFDLANTTTLDLAFGRDDLVKVTIKPIDKMSGQHGVFNKTNERRMRDTFVISNLHKKPIKVRVLDASPVARNEAIQIEPKFTPPVTVNHWDGRQGVVAWTATLAPNQTQEFTADYRIEWPQDKNIHGLR